MTLLLLLLLSYYFFDTITFPFHKFRAYLMPRLQRFQRFPSSLTRWEIMEITIRPGISTESEWFALLQMIRKWNCNFLGWSNNATITALQHVHNASRTCPIIRSTNPCCEPLWQHWTHCISLLSFMCAKHPFFSTIREHRATDLLRSGTGHFFPDVSLSVSNISTANIFYLNLGVNPEF